MCDICKDETIVHHEDCPGFECGYYGCDELPENKDHPAFKDI